MLIYYVIIGVIALFSWLVSNRLQQKFDYYSKVYLRNGMSGAEIAQKMLFLHLSLRHCLLDLAHFHNRLLPGFTGPVPPPLLINELRLKFELLYVNNRHL